MRHPRHTGHPPCHTGLDPVSIFSFGWLEKWTPGQARGDVGRLG